MGRLSIAALVVGSIVAIPWPSAGQIRGGGVAAPGSPTSGSGPSLPGPVIPPLGPVFADPSQRRPPVSPAPFQSRLVFRPSSTVTPEDQFPVFWFGYWNFYPFWTLEFTPSVAAAPLAWQEGVPTGGLQLDVEPRRAQVYVDGLYVGVVGSFSGYYHNLELTAGPHQIDLLLDRFPPQTINLVVTPGRTTTYRGTLGAVTRVD